MFIRGGAWRLNFKMHHELARAKGLGLARGYVILGQECFGQAESHIENTKENKINKQENAKNLL